MTQITSNLGAVFYLVNWQHQTDRFHSKGGISQILGAHDSYDDENLYLENIWDKR